MSYGFNVRAATKAEAKEKVAAALNQVVVSQPVHALDKDQAAAAASAFIDLLPDDDTKDVAVSVNGSVGWSGNYPTEHVVVSASVSVSAHLTAKEA